MENLRKMVVNRLSKRILVEDLTMVKKTKIKIKTKIETDFDFKSDSNQMKEVVVYCFAGFVLLQINKTHSQN